MSDQKLNLWQKLNAISAVIPQVPKTSNPNVSYKSIDLNDLYEHITPAFNAVGIVRSIIEREATVSQFEQETKNGKRTMFTYSATLDITYRNAEAPEETETETIFVVGQNDDPAKAKGSSWSYALKYYYAAKFGVNTDPGDDPDKHDTTGNYSSSESKPTISQGSGNVTEKQEKRFYAIMFGAGKSKEEADGLCLKHFGKPITQLSRDEYNKICDHYGQEKSA